MAVGCKWIASDQARVLIGRHLDDCDSEECPSCQPCTMDHCRVCSVIHANGACPDCLAEVRENLDELRRMCGDLPAESQERGVDSESFNLLGPASDPEARGHWEASVLAGRIVPVDCDARDLSDVKDWLETAAHELHPLIVIGGWGVIYRDAFEHAEPVGRVEVLAEVGYLERNLTEMGEMEFVPFSDFARDVRRCVAHMERVLHDGEQVDRGAPCMACGKPLERTWGMNEDRDGWRCPRCHTTSTDAQYRFAVAHLHREEATHLTDRDMEIRVGVKAGTLRVWANRGLIGRHVESGRVVFSVAEVEAEARQRGLLAS